MDAESASRCKPRVILFTWSIPHYRAALYRRLSLNAQMEFTVCTGEDASTHGGGKVALAEAVGGPGGIRRRLIRSRRIHGPVFRGFEWQPEALTIAWRERPDAVITFGTRSLSNWLLRVVCALRGIALLDWGQGAKGPQRGLKWWVRRIYLESADALLLYGQWARNHFVERGIRPEKIFVVGNSLDHEAQVRLRESITPAEIRSVRTHFGVSGQDDRMIVHSGRLETRKKLNLLFEALTQMRQRGRRVVAVLIGDGPQEPALHRLAEAQGVADRVQFVGAVYEEETLARIFMAADLCVAPGAVGLLAMHSLVYGTPILTAHNIHFEHGPEIEAVVEGQTGSYFRADDIFDLADKLEAMLFPRPLKADMAARCMAMIDQHYTPEHQEVMFLKGLRYALAAHRA